MARKEIVVGEIVNGNEILSISGEGRQRKYEVKRPCGHSALLGEWQLLYGKPPKEGFTGCAICRISVQHIPASGERMIGRKLGTFEVIALSDKRMSNRCLWNLRCSVCGFEKQVASAIIVQNKPNSCEQCRKIAYEKIRANNALRVFTEEETKIITGKIRAGIFSIAGSRSQVDHLACTEDDERIQNAWAQLLKCDLTNRSLDSICALACGIGKNQSRRMFNKPVAQFVEPYADAETGEEVRSVNCLPMAEPDYEYESEETDMHRDNLHEALAELTSEERSLLLQDDGSVSVQDKTARAILLNRLKSAITIPSIQIQPLY